MFVSCVAAGCQPNECATDEKTTTGASLPRAVFYCSSSKDILEWGRVIIRPIVSATVRSLIN
jgi:hypothetical protein